MFWNRKPLEKPFSEKLSARVAKIPTADLVQWIEQAMNETNRSCSNYMKMNDITFLEDMLIGAEAIHCLVNELHKRSVL